MFLDLPGRVAKLLVGLSLQRGEERDDGIVLDLQMSQSNLAGMVGGWRPTVNQILRSFEARGYLDMQGQRLLIKDPEQLKRRAYL